MNKYSFSQQLLHQITLSSNLFKEIYFDLEKIFFLNKAPKIEDDHVFITGMARSGTTILLNAIYGSNQFASFTYQEMPFVLAPNLWSSINRGGIVIAKTERAHEDGIMIDTNSPEAFEEVFWKTFDADESDTYDDFKKLMQLLCMRYSKTRYLSKNNQNIKRIDKIIGYYPSSKIIIPFREPLQNAFSLLNQHNKFNSIQNEDNFIRKYMSWIGHSEFGMDYDPLFKDGTIHDDQNDLNHWLEQWLLCHRSLQQYQSNPNVRFNCYESLCNDPGRWESLLDLIKLEDMPDFDFHESKKKISISYDKSLYDKCRELYKDLLITAK